MKPVFSFQRGRTPLLVSIPHAGTVVPGAIRTNLSEKALGLPDTDWYVDRLYHWVMDRGAGLLVANYSRYVIDLNRPPDNAALYSGPGTGLLPELLFDGSPLYTQGSNRVATELPQRRLQYWNPYHEKIAAELEHIRERFGYAILLDAHSIRSEVPRLFEGKLPDLNLGSNSGASAHPDLITASFSSLGSDKQYSTVLDGRFKGGYITRHYGKPAEGCHALQLEMSQSSYMREQPPRYDQVLAAPIQNVLRGFVDTLLDWSPS
ncbi:MAG: N-formylglutamate deformylase [Lysobacterales bacterium]